MFGQSTPAYSPNYFFSWLWTGITIQKSKISFDWNYFNLFLKMYPSIGLQAWKCFTMVWSPLVPPPIPTMNHYGCCAQLALPKLAGTPCTSIFKWDFGDYQTRGSSESSSTSQRSICYLEKHTHMQQWDEDCFWWIAGKWALNASKNQ